MRTKVVFYFPWKEVSGGPFYLTKLANNLAEDDKYEVYYTDYPNGLSEPLLTNPNVKTIEYNDSSFEMPIDEPITLITPIYWAHKVPKMHPDSKILFLNWHYCCIPVLKSDSRWKKSFINEFLKLVKKTNSCFFLDKSHLLGQNTKKIKFQENFVPIILNEKNFTAKEELLNDEINVTVLGRLDGDKVYATLNVLDNINSLKINKKINVSIIGDGVHREKLEEEIANAGYHYNIKFTGVLLNDDLNSYLANEADILFAMGTSVLEGAPIKLPCVIIPSNTTKFYDDKYVYLQDSKGYALAPVITVADNCSTDTLCCKDNLSIFNPSVLSCGISGESFILH